jgi:hypothetical protein
LQKYSSSSSYTRRVEKKSKMGNMSEAVMNKKNVKRDENQTGVVCGARGETTSRRNEGG